MLAHAEASQAEAAESEEGMIYSDDELKRWWKGLTNQDKSELIQTVFEKAYSPRMRQMATDWQKKMQAGQELGAFELQALRKWAK